MNIVFFGTPQYAVPVLETLINNPLFKVCAVITQPDKPVGRKQLLTPSPTSIFAGKQKIKVFDPASIIHTIESVKELSPDIGVLAAYGKILPKQLIDLFACGILVIHPSLLPKYRGASPVQAAILNGDKETGVTIFKMDKKLDHGPIISQFKEEIKDDDTAGSLYTRLFKMAADALTAILPAWIEGKIKPQEQNHSQASFTRILKKEDGYIPPEFLKSAMEGKEIKKPSASTLERFIRAMSPWPGAWTKIKVQSSKFKVQRKRLKILKAHLEPLAFLPERKAIPFPERKAKKLVLNQVQLEGKKPVSWKEFLHGHPNTSKVL